MRSSTPSGTARRRTPSTYRGSSRRRLRFSGSAGTGRASRFRPSPSTEASSTLRYSPTSIQSSFAMTSTTSACYTSPRGIASRSSPSGTSSRLRESTSGATSWARMILWCSRATWWGWSRRRWPLRSRPSSDTCPIPSTTPARRNFSFPSISSLFHSLCLLERCGGA